MPLSLPLPSTAMPSAKGVASTRMKPPSAGHYPPPFGPPFAWGGEADAADPRLPAPGGRRLVVLVDVPERAVVGGIDRQRGVVAPPSADRLGARAVDQHALAQGQLAERVTGQPAGVADAREDRRGV